MSTKPRAARKSKRPPAPDGKWGVARKEGWHDGHDGREGLPPRPVLVRDIEQYRAGLALGAEARAAQSRAEGANP